MNSSSQPTVLICSANDLQHSGLYRRFTRPAEAAGIRLLHASHHQPVPGEKLAAADLVIVQGAFPRFVQAYDRVVTVARAARVPVIYDLDRDLLNLPRDHPERRIYHPSDTFFPIWRAITEADAVTGASARLGEILGAIHPAVWLLAPVLDERIWPLQPVPPVGRKVDPVVIGLFGQWDTDFELDMIIPVLQTISDRYPEGVAYKFFGFQPPTNLLGLAQLEWIPISPGSEADRAAALGSRRCDLFIVPYRESEYHQALPLLCDLELATLGIPGVYSRLDPFIARVENGRSGYFASTFQEWFDSIDRLVKSPELRHSLSVAAQNSVQKYYRHPPNIPHLGDVMAEIVQYSKLNLDESIEPRARIQARANLRLKEFLNEVDAGLYKQKLSDWAPAREMRTGDQDRHAGLRAERDQRLSPHPSVGAGQLSRRTTRGGRLRNALRASIRGIFPPASRQRRLLFRLFAPERLVRREFRPAPAALFLDAVQTSVRQTEGSAPRPAGIPLLVFPGRGAWTNAADAISRLDPGKYSIHHLSGWDPRTALTSFESLQSELDLYGGLALFDSPGWQPLFNPLRNLHGWKCVYLAESQELSSETLPRSLDLVWSFPSSETNARNWTVEFDRALLDLFPSVSIIVLTYNNLEDTRRCLESVFTRTGYPRWEVIVVDNGSRDGTGRYLRSLADSHPALRLILNNANAGFAAGNNQGAKSAQGDILVFLNNDTVVTGNWLWGLVKRLRDAQVGMVGPVTNSSGNQSKIPVTYTDLSGMESFAQEYTRARRGQGFEIPMLAFFCLALRREVFQQVGPLDEQFGQGFFEDDDYAVRVKQHGYRLICVRDVFVHHRGSASFYKIDDERFQRLYRENRVLFEQKWNTIWKPHEEGTE